MGMLRVKVPDPTMPGTTIWVDVPTVGPRGPQGLQGPPGGDGPPGLQGDPGPTVVSTDAGNTAVLGTDSFIYVPAVSAAATSYLHAQGTAAAVWTIDHPLAFLPNVTVIDSSGRQVEGDVVYTSPTQVQVTFSGAFAGQAILS